MSGYSNPLINKAFEEIRAEPKEQILNVNESQYIEHILAKFRLEVPEIFESQKTVDSVERTVEVERDAVDRAQKILDYNSRRAKLGLADRSDALQAEANLQLRALELQTALDQQRSSALLFNAQREVASEQHAEKAFHEMREGIGLG